MGYFAKMQEDLAGKPPLLMGIVNVTPNSFSDGGLAFESPNAIELAQRLAAEGAELIDLGAESTAPGAEPVPEHEEQRRLLPVVTALAPKLPLSIDTFKSAVADRMLQLGARVINDVSGLRADPRMAAVVAEHKASVIIMHSKESGAHPHVTDSRRDYKDVVAEVTHFLLGRAEYALGSGIGQDCIALDPGIGRFLSHDPKYSWELLRRYSELVEGLSPFPIVIASSRKGFLGGALQSRDPISQLTALWATQRGAKIVRTHAPGMMKQFLEAERATNR